MYFRPWNSLLASRRGSPSLMLDAPAPKSGGREGGEEREGGGGVAAGGRCHVSYFDADLGQHGPSAAAAAAGPGISGGGGWRRRRWWARKSSQPPALGGSVRTCCHGPKRGRVGVDKAGIEVSPGLNSALLGGSGASSGGCVERSGRINKTWTAGKQRGGGGRRPWFSRTRFNKEPRRLCFSLSLIFFIFFTLPAPKRRVFSGFHELGKRHRATEAAAAGLRCATSG